MPAPRALQVFVLEGIGEIAPGADLANVILGSITTDDGVTLLQDGDILAVTSKIVSKAEGRIVLAEDREHAISDETVRVVATREHPGGVTRIVENRQGLVMAAAGVDASNTPDGVVLLLPADPDESARALCAALRERTGLRLGVLITDTAGRPWREGQTDIAIGAAGVAVLDDLRGTTDVSGRRLDATIAAVADEIAGAADLVKGKTSGNPVAVVRGLDQLVLDAEGAAGARMLQRPSESDMFRLGSTEAHAEGYAEGYAAGFAAAAVTGGAAGGGGVGGRGGAGTAEVGGAGAGDDVEEPS